MDLDPLDLARLSRDVGQAWREWVILAEGNLSSRATPESMYVKASGRQMVDARPTDFLEVKFGPLLALLDNDAAGDAEVAETFAQAGTGDSKPSVESLLHAVCQTIGGARVVLHTHPVAVNAILCSDQAPALVNGSVFPDQVVVLGPAQLLVPYTDPGLTLARLARRELSDHIDRHGEAPKAIYLRNHGMFALGQSSVEVMNITAMACKTAQVITGALAAGSVVYLAPADVQRLHRRDDEISRRAELLRGSQRVPIDVER